MKQHQITVIRFCMALKTPQAEAFVKMIYNKVVLAAIVA